jgi:hypothetical protein
VCPSHMNGVPSDRGARSPVHTGLPGTVRLNDHPGKVPTQRAFNEGSPASRAYWTRKASGSLIPLTGVHFLPQAISGLRNRGDQGNCRHTVRGAVEARQHFLRAIPP